MTLQLSQIAMSMLVTVPISSLERHVAASPLVIGEQLAADVHNYVIKQNIGYYPAIDYFEANGGIDAELISAAHHISWIISGMVRNEIRIRMRPVFSNIKFESIQTMAFMMPKCRPNQANAKAALVAHYTINTVKATIRATLIQRFHDASVAERMAREMAYKWLGEHVEKLEICSAKCLTA